MQLPLLYVLNIVSVEFCSYFDECGEEYHRGKLLFRIKMYSGYLFYLDVSLSGRKEQLQYINNMRWL